jgi:ribosomal protein S18 acetylase RimI-like enzyme
MDQANVAVATRRANPDDVKPIEALETRAFASDRLSARSLRDYLKSPAATVLVAEDDAGRLAAMPSCGSAGPPRSPGCTRSRWRRMRGAAVSGNSC